MAFFRLLLSGGFCHSVGCRSASALTVTVKMSVGTRFWGQKLPADDLFFSGMIAQSRTNLFCGKQIHVQVDRRANLEGSKL
jgi:hypothetical protein